MRACARARVRAWARMREGGRACAALSLKSRGRRLDSTWRRFRAPGMTLAPLAMHQPSATCAEEAGVSRPCRQAARRASAGSARCLRRVGRPAHLVRHRAHRADQLVEGRIGDIPGEIERRSEGGHAKLLLAMSAAHFSAMSFRGPEGRYDSENLPVSMPRPRGEYASTCAAGRG